jgi:hypothetical protein
MKNIFGALIILTLFSCNSKNKDKSSGVDSIVTSALPYDSSERNELKLKTIKEVKLALLDARCEKAELLLGKPDKKGRVLSDMGGETYYMIYFDKVVGDDGITKNLLLTIYTESGISDNSKINTVDAVYTTKYIDHGVSINIKSKNVTSDGRAFTVGDGTKDWSEIYQE